MARTRYLPLHTGFLWLLPPYIAVTIQHGVGLATSFLLQFIYPCHDAFSVFSGENDVLTSVRMNDADQSRTVWLLGDIWMLPSAADEEWNSPKRPYSTVANLQLLINLYAEVSTFFLSTVRAFQSNSLQST